MMLESERVLGPRWSLKELRTFYILLKAHGRQWEKLEERLPGRSEAMARALFEMHRGYLSLPEASVDGFCAIMMDHYESVDDLQQRQMLEEDKKRPSWLQDVDMKTENGQEDAPAQRNRKKRRLEKLLDDDQLATRRIRSQGDMQLKRADSGEQNEVLLAPKRLRKKSGVPLKARAWLGQGEERDKTGLSEIKGARFDLPWTHWFYSYVDVDFFQHNEFVECLTRMGLGKITAAARPIWSSVRASMGRPRRLSPLFFSQEKAKLETYRAVKRRFDPSHQPDGTWPYQCPTPLHPGVAVIVRMESQHRFHLGTVARIDSSEGFCHVSFYGNTDQEVSVACSLDNTMVLDFPRWPGIDQEINNEPKPAATTLLRRDNCTSASPLTPPKSIGSVDIQYREDKLRAVLAVKSLLHRKEQIILALSSLNKHVAEQQVHIHEQNAMTSSLWTTPTAFSSAAVKDLAWTNSHEKDLVQRQHAWLSSNLNETNAHLMAALLSLQSFTSTDQLGPQGVPGAAYPAEDVTWSGEVTLPTDTLSAEQMRWAIDFLSSSQKKAATVVTKSALQVNDGVSLPTQDVAAISGQDRRHVLPDTMQIIVKCVTLMSVLHRHGAAAAGVPPVITQKLVERVLELLKPFHETNMDLYTELRAAAVQVATQPPMSSND